MTLTVHLTSNMTYGSDDLSGTHWAHYFLPDNSETSLRLSELDP